MSDAQDNPEIRLPPPLVALIAVARAVRMALAMTTPKPTPELL
jgi:hypothetical protein